MQRVNQFKLVQRIWPYWHIPVSLVAAIVLWEVFVRVSEYPAFLLPPPGRVLARLQTVLASGLLFRHTMVTLVEVLAGLGLGLLVATALGYTIAKSRLLERFLAPYIVASQAVPTVAIAPLLIIWFGSGQLSKVLICALIVFFPILINVIVGLRSVPEDLYSLMRVYKASPLQIFWKLEVRAALPVLLGGLKIGATLAVIGAVVGEFIGADAGLGFLIVAARGQFDTALVFVAVLALVGMALTLYGAISLIEQRVLRWQQRDPFSQ